MQPVSPETSHHTMTRTAPAETKLVICAPHRFPFWTPPAEIAGRIRAKWPGMAVLDLREAEALPQEISDADIFVGFVLRAEQFALARKLKWIHSTAASVAQFLSPEVRSSGIVMTNARGMQSVTMAEHILGMLVALARRFPDCFQYQQQARWAQRELWEAPVRPRELRGQALLIVGFGEIGRAAAKLVAPLGMRVLAVTRSGIGPANGVEKLFAVERLPELLPEADFVLLSAPETPETRQMIGARELSLMKPTAYLINVARGALVDEAALIAALERGQIAGAALDVTQHEPLDAASPLWRLVNVFLTPHVSAVSGHLWERQGGLLIENLERWFSGRELLNRVDLARGY